MPKNLSASDVDKFQESFCETALAMIETHGLENTSLRSIAKAYGCSSMTPYRYFKDKDELLDIIRARGFETFIDRLDNVLDSQLEPTQKMALLAREYFDFALEKHTLYLLMFNRKAYPDTTHPRLQKQLDRLNHTWLHSANISHQSGIDDFDPELAAQLFWSSMHGLVALHLSGSLHDKWHFEHLALKLIETLFKGFTSPSNAAIDIALWD